MKRVKTGICLSLPLRLYKFSGHCLRGSIAGKWPLYQGTRERYFKLSELSLISTFGKNMRRCVKPEPMMLSKTRDLRRK